MPTLTAISTSRLTPSTFVFERVLRAANLFRPPWAPASEESSHALLRDATDPLRSRPGGFESQWYGYDEAA
jgi:hypothetical protein